MKRYGLSALAAVTIAAVMGGCPLLSTQTQILYYANGDPEGSAVLQMDLDGENRVSLWQGADDIRGVQATADGSRILVHVVHNLEQSSLITIGEDGTATTIVQEGRGIQQPALTADGSRVVFSSWGESGSGLVLRSMKADGSDPRDLSGELGYLYDHAVSPVDLQVAFVGAKDGQYGIFIVSAEGGQPVPVASDTGYDYCSRLAFSPDGSRVAWCGQQAGDSDIYVANTDGTNRVNLSDSPDYEGVFSFSPDGARVAYQSSVDQGASSLYVVNVDGTGRRKLAEPRHGWSSWAWSPDGRRIAVVADSDGSGDICVLDVGTGTVTQLTPSPTDGSSPVWAPDGRVILFHSRTDGQSHMYRVQADGEGQAEVTDEGGGMFARFVERP